MTSERVRLRPVEASDSAGARFVKAVVFARSSLTSLLAKRRVRRPVRGPLRDARCPLLLNGLLRGRCTAPTPSNGAAWQLSSAGLTTCSDGTSMTSPSSWRAHPEPSLHNCLGPTSGGVHNSSPAPVVSARSPSVDHRIPGHSPTRSASAWPPGTRRSPAWLRHAIAAAATLCGGEPDRVRFETHTRGTRGWWQHSGHSGPAQGRSEVPDVGRGLRRRCRRPTPRSRCPSGVRTIGRCSRHNRVDRR